MREIFEAHLAEPAAQLQLAQAVEIVRRRRPELEIDGEVQADIALDRAKLHELFPFTRLTDGANVLIFPSLAAGNAAYTVLATLRGLGEAPTRSAMELAKRLGVTEAEASALVVSGQAPPSASDVPAAAPAQSPASPLLGMTAPNGASGVPRIRLSTCAVIAARKRATRGKMCS